MTELLDRLESVQSALSRMHTIRDIDPGLYILKYGTHAAETRDYLLGVRDSIRSAIHSLAGVSQAERQPA